MSDSEIEKLITKIIEERLKGGVAYGIGNSAQLEDVNNIAIIDIPKLQNILKEIIKQKLRENGNNLKKIENDKDFKIAVGNIKTRLDNNYTANNIEIYNNTITVPFILKATLTNGKITERTFGTKENGQQYTQEEVKMILKEAEEIECDEKFKDKRLDKFTFLSMIVDVDDKLVGISSKNPIRFPTPDLNDKYDNFDNIKDIIKNAKQDPNSPNILLIPYSASNAVGGHIVTLVVDMSKIIIDKANDRVGFGQGSIKCFDSSHYFTKFFKDSFPKFLRDLLENNDDKGQINIHTPQLDNFESGTCSFYTEAFCYLVSEYIQNNEDKDIDLNSIKEYINSKEFIKQLEDKKEEFFNQYKATMEEVKQKREKEDKIKLKTYGIEMNGEIKKDCTNEKLNELVEQMVNIYGAIFKNTPIESREEGSRPPTPISQPSETPPPSRSPSPSMSSSDN